jgi:hypothetical protein
MPVMPPLDYETPKAKTSRIPGLILRMLALPPPDQRDVWLLPLVLCALQFPCCFVSFLLGFKYANRDMAPQPVDFLRGSACEALGLMFTIPAIVTGARAIVFYSRSRRYVAAAGCALPLLLSLLVLFAMTVDWYVNVYGGS